MCVFQMQVMDNKLFSIEPRRGKLLPGESHTVSLTYRFVSEINIDCANKL